MPEFYSQPKSATVGFSVGKTDAPIFFNVYPKAKSTFVW